MISLVAATLALLQTPATASDTGIKVATTIRGEEITRPGDKTASALIRLPMEALDPARKSPKKFGANAVPWEFDWLTAGYLLQPQFNQFNLRIRVYAQEKREKDDLGPRVARMLTSLCGEANRRMGIDNPRAFNNGIVDVFLCWGGKAGGEQRYERADVGDRTNVPLNSIYIYDVRSFNDPTEMAREVAHEYGHAILPAVGGYTEPEDWAHGYLGEKVFLRWLSQGMAEGRFNSDDAMGATQAQLDAWLAKNADPLIVSAATQFPTATLLTDKSAKGMDNYMGLALFASMVLPDTVFGKSLLYTGSTDAKDYPQALILATDEPSTYEVTIPKLLAGKAIWLPLGKGKITGGKILKFKDGWAYVVANEGKLTVVNRKD